MNKYIFKFETKLLLQNFSSLFFGMVFPILMSFLIISGLKDIPSSLIDEVKRSIVLTISIISPLSIFLVGLSALFAKDLEEGVYDRLDLFSINHLSMAKYKFIVYYLFWTVCNIFYFGVMKYALGVNIPLISIIKHTGFVTLIAVASFFIGYSICIFFKKFSISFSLSMGIYFLSMILGGMMGIQVEDMPKGIKKIAQLIPISHFSSIEYVNEVAKGSKLNYSFFQSLIVLVLLSLVLFTISIYKNKRKSN
ncbi:MAG: ABC transporter permease [Finegoldia magna]|nr:ABC transporter permease [Finegoldia magna]